MGLTDLSDWSHCVFCKNRFGTRYVLRGYHRRFQKRQTPTLHGTSQNVKHGLTPSRHTVQRFCPPGNEKARALISPVR
jgi:hypothetical protein